MREPWYNYLTGETIVATGQPQQVTLQCRRIPVLYRPESYDTNWVNDIPVDNLYFKLKVYPSPGSDAKVEFTLPEDGNVRLTIINNLGQVMTSYYAGFKRKGTYTIGMKDIPGAPGNPAFIS
jgi:P pilus assembly chaperone PapD